MLKIIMLFLTLLLLCGGSSLLSSALERPVFHPEDYEYYFNTFIEEYDRQYADEQTKQKRFEIFKQNLERINKQNSESENAVFGINNFTDLTMKEFKAQYTGYRKGDEPSGCTVNYGKDLAFTEAPESFDWRQQNKVTRVKNQSRCGSCYAFGTIGSLEGQYAIKYNELVEFSEQQIVSCDKSERGCDGGWPSSVSLALRDMGGAMTEEDYPYEGTVSPCRFDVNRVKTRVSGCVQYVGLNEDTLMGVLHSVGPLAIVVDVTGLNTYNGGILMDCPAMTEDHVVLLVGYGTENGTPYWTIKNSWGPSWGENGYIRVRRGVNSCLLLNNDITSVTI